MLYQLAGMASMGSYIITFGSNIGDKVRNIERALILLSRYGTFTNLSRVYLTESIGPSQPDFVNGGFLFHCTLLPLDILKLLKTIELEVGRKPREKWGPREIDLDIIWSSFGEFNSSLLVLPHPEWNKRLFVVEILLDLGLKSFYGYTLSDLKIALKDQVVIPLPCITARFLNLLDYLRTNSLLSENFK
ncbi:MAG: 2-amino-4-hydroxy-6-hydroxymethyldihydropteridine diphosphokinase [Thermosulfidibacteraceae bacterium]